MNNLNEYQFYRTNSPPDHHRLRLSTQGCLFIQFENHLNTFNRFDADKDDGAVCVLVFLFFLSSQHMQ